MPPAAWWNEGEGRCCLPARGHKACIAGQLALLAAAAARCQPSGAPALAACCRAPRQSLWPESVYNSQSRSCCCPPADKYLGPAALLQTYRCRRLHRCQAGRGCQAGVGCPGPSLQGHLCHLLLCMLAAPSSPAAVSTSRAPPAPRASRWMIDSRDAAKAERLASVNDQARGQACGGWAAAAYILQGLELAPGAAPWCVCRNALRRAAPPPTAGTLPSACSISCGAATPS